MANVLHAPTAMASDLKRHDGHGIGDPGEFIEMGDIATRKLQGRSPGAGKGK